ncbi:MAG: imidazole glycerol phosphate synthase subunit HisH [Verrucomicrobiota bacterium]|nr:imidazole glycerol phosphate synthase subunit HisH [Verrucomicrobiota bacterium]
MIAIVDYGAGNLRSVQNAFEKVGAQYELVGDGEGLRRASKIVLPGVGHFGQMMRALDALDVRGEIKQRIAEGVPFLGVCLGLQALFEWSEESPETPGLGIFRGRVERFAADARVPHMGWNKLEAVKPSRLFAKDEAEQHVYFAHSYYAPVCDETAVVCHYSRSFTAALESGNCFGVQFHPEKSGAVGLEIVRRFADL